MKINVHQFSSKHDFDIIGTSYAGNPQDNTAMYITKKVDYLLDNLDRAIHCLVFVEKGIKISDKLFERHAFICSDRPQLDYAQFAQKLEKEKMFEESNMKYHLTKEGYYISETAVVGDNAYIEPNCIIGHNVIIGDNCRILAGTVIKNAVIGNYFLSNEHAVIGAYGFTMTEDEKGNQLRIPSLGRVLIGDHVEVGAHDNISCGSAGDTIIEDFTKIDALVHIGHDCHLEKNVRITAGSIIGGFAHVGEGVFIGVNASLRNRIEIGEGATIGMGAVVTKDIDANTTVVGNPARLFEKSDCNS